MALPTPCYLIDEERLQRNLEVVARLTGASGARAVLALKCFASWATFDQMRPYLAGTTSSSLYEARLGREEFGREVHAYAVAWSAEEVAEVAGYADKVIFNSASQLARHHAAVAHLPLGVRVNPGVSNSGWELADPCRPQSRLGVSDPAELERLLPQLSGVMFHFNCENDDLAALRAALDTIATRFGPALEALDWVSLGGGIAFTAPGYPLDELAATLRAFAGRFGVQVYLEPGEAVITGAGELVTTVLDVVRNEVDIAVVDASVEAHLLDHLIYRTSPPLAAPAPGPHRVVVAGRSCLAGDLFGEYDVAHPLAVGDEVRFGDAAGYSIVKKSWFNGLPMPSIALRRRDGSVEVVRRFGYDDFKSNLS